MSRSALAAGVRYLRTVVAPQGRRENNDEQLLHAFVVDRDETAFAALVRRYGPMVGGVCRRVLGHQQDAEDAFQATFLVLSRNAATLKKKSSLASFLHGTAYRIALNAKRTAARRRKYEGSVGALTQPRSPVDELSWREIRTLVDEEIARLPEKYRSAFILCCLESVSQAEAARRLGLKEGTLSSRLTTARKLLSERLSRRGVELTAVLAATALAAQAAPALSPLLVASTIKAALGEETAGLVSASVAELVQSVTTAATLSKVKLATVVLLAVSLLTVATSGSLVFLYGRASGPLVATAEPPAARDEVASPKREGTKTVEIGGRVLDPDGKPVRGAKLLFLWWFAKLPTKVWATSDADGRFSFTVARSPAANSGWEIRGRELPYVMASAEGYGFAVAPVEKPEAAANLTLRLVKDDVPIRGRILNLEGKPIAGVTVRVNDHEPLNQAQFYVPKSGDLGNWLAALKANKKDPWRIEEDHLTELASPTFHLLFPPVTTGADGRFELRGVGPERMVHLRIEGPTVATQIVSVMTRPGEAIRRPLSRNHPRGEAITYHSATFEVLTEPTKPVVGVVRDRATGKPLAGVTITPNKIANPWNIMNHNQWLIRTTTDKDGRYQLVGLPKGDDNQLLARTDDLPYLPLSKRVENTPGLGSVTVDFELKRGIWVTGRVTEKTTGRPLEGGVGYYCFRDNPNHTDIPSVLLGYGLGTREDGSYRIAVVPGRGLIAVQVSHNNRYLSSVGVEKIKAPHINPIVDSFDTVPFPCQIPNRNTLVEINPKPDEESLTCDLIVVPARSLKGTVLGPDGQPLAGARQYRWDTLPGSEFTVWGLPADKLPKPREIDFVHEGKKLAGFVTVYGDEKEPLQVRLQPWGTLTGRLVTLEGKPLTGVKVSCTPNVGDDHTDKDGRFHIEGLTPGLKHGVYVSKESRVLTILGGEPKELIVKSGETMDLGVLKVKVME